MLESGNLRAANRFLGHPHLLCGRADKGFLPWGAGVLPLPRGVYAADVLLPDGTAAAASPVLSLPNGLELTGLPVSGEVQVEFIDRLPPEEQL